MIYTSYFSKLKYNMEKFPGYRHIAISNTQPKGIQLEECEDVIPNWKMVNEAKSTGNFDKYIAHLVMNLDPKKVLEEIGDNVILYCWEGSENPCHRHYLAAWLNLTRNAGIEEV